jgi:hypothetical protein
MHGTGHADVLVVLQMPGNKADAVPCERLQYFHAIAVLIKTIKSIVGSGWQGKMI